MNAPLLRVAHLSLARTGNEHGRRARIDTPAPAGPAGPARDLLVDDVSFDIARGECLGLIGASGSGKTLTGLAIAGVLPGGGHQRQGTIDIAADADVHADGGRSFPTAMVFQDPRAALSPVRRIGAQLDDVLRAAGMRTHNRSDRSDRRAAALALLAEVGLDAPADCLERYAFELSGGMCQRVMIALALARRPRLLIADEPTTGLDTRTQARVLDLLREVATARAMGTLLITHDLAVACRYCTRIAVLHAGRIVEILPAGRFLSDAAHPRSRALIAAMPQTARDVAALSADVAVRGGHALPPPGATLPGARLLSVRSSHALPPPGATLPATPLLSVRGVLKHYGPRDGAPVLDDIGFDLAPGEALGVVGSSGCGKSTLAHVLARVTAVDAGSIVFEGVEIATVGPRRAARARWRSALQLLFQDARASLDPLSRVRDALAASWHANAAARASADRPTSLDDDIAALAAQVALPLALLDRRPHQLSGGEATRVGLARALASRPRLLILDEPTASLDMTTQAEIVRTIDTLRREHDMALLFISHDLDLVRLLCARVLVMDTGRIVEAGDCERVFRSPAHPVTRALLDARLRVEADSSGSTILPDSIVTRSWPT